MRNNADGMRSYDEGARTYAESMRNYVDPPVGRKPSIQEAAAAHGHLSSICKMQTNTQFG